MTIHTTWNVHCDGARVLPQTATQARDCQLSLDGALPESAAEARRIALDRGWRRMRGPATALVDLCPQCASKYKRRLARGQQ